MDFCTYFAKKSRKNAVFSDLIREKLADIALVFVESYEILKKQRNSQKNY